VSVAFPLEVVYHHRRNRKTTMRSRLTFFIVAIAILLGSGPAARSLSRRTLTFAERVAYQYAIEEVYWRHRIWPRNGGENPRPKPALDEIMSCAQIEKKVEDYLCASQVLADQQRPITATELQAEMDRMAGHTKQPEVLRKLFAALNNDPFVIAECLARPILAERLIASSAVAAGVSLASSVVAGVPPASRNSFAADTAASTGKDSVAYSLPEISVPLDCVNDTWTPTTVTNAPAAREAHAAVWTGSEMIIWGGDAYPQYINTGGRYNPSTDSWTGTSTMNAPSRRRSHRAIWSGTEMIVWGGTDDVDEAFNTGGRYNPSTDSWTVTSTMNVPEARFNHTAVWSGSEMVVWGGWDAAYLNTGGRYNPSKNSWTAISTINAPVGRVSQTAVWTGSEMTVWGGLGDPGNLNTGGRYNPSTNS